MTFETQYQLEQFREIQDQYFDENNELWRGLIRVGDLHRIMEQMLTLINQLEIEIIKRDMSEKYENNSLAQSFIDMDKAKDELFKSIAIICKDYEQKHIKKFNQ
jgi:hypothetical protein